MSKHPADMFAAIVAIILHAFLFIGMGTISFSTAPNPYPERGIKIRLGDSDDGSLIVSSANEKGAVEQSDAPEDKLIKIAAEPKEKPKQLENKPRTSGIVVTETKGNPYGNSYDNDAIFTPTYIQLLQASVQDKSAVPYEAKRKNISGRAVLRLSFNRMGYVLKYTLIQPSGYAILDEAALDVARRLTYEPFPPVPVYFEPRKKLLTYDFPISFKPN